MPPARQFQYRRLAEILWPLGGALLGLLVMPLAIDQYPESFHENTWILPISAFCVVALFVVPLLLHERFVRAVTYLMRIPRVGIVLAILLPLVLAGVSVVGGIKLFRVHHAHLTAVLAKHTPLSSLEQPYDLTSERRAKLIRLLKPPVTPSTLKIGCVSWSERSCVAAGTFLVVFSEAGWKIADNRVFRLEPQIPGDGVFVISQPEPGAPLPPHLGRWHKATATELTIWNALNEIGIPVTPSTDTSLPDGITGVYFGPEPSRVEINSETLRIRELMKFVAEGTAIQQDFSVNNDRKKELQERTEWVTEVSAWLQANLGKSSAVKFSNAQDIEDKKRCLIGFADDIGKSKPR